MKYPVLVLLAFSSTTAFSYEPSADQVRGMEASLDATVVQLQLPNNCRGAEQKKNFQDQVVEEVKSDYPKLAKFLEDGMATSAAVAQVGLVAGFGAGSYAQSEKNAYNFRLAQRLTSVSYLSYGVAASAIASASSAQLGSYATGPSSTKLLNTDQLNEFAQKNAKETATIFSLGQNEESTIRAAIKTAITKKFHAKDETPLDYFKVLKSASFAGKSVFSPDKMEVLERMAETSRRSGGKKPNAEEISKAVGRAKDKANDANAKSTLAELAAATSALELCLARSEAGQNPYKTEALLRVAKNKETLAKAEESIGRAQAGAASPGEGDQKSLDAE